jgi:hypothetical protein
LIHISIASKLIIPKPGKEIKNMTEEIGLKEIDGGKDCSDWKFDEEG